MSELDEMTPKMRFAVGEVEVCLWNDWRGIQILGRTVGTNEARAVAACLIAMADMGDSLD